MKQRCSQCDDEHDIASMVQLADGWVCTDCKPRYEQELREGVAHDAVLKIDPYNRSALIWWEKMRVVYNIVLLGAALLLAFPLCAKDPFGAFLFGVVANAFYCLGPLADLYYNILYKRKLGGQRYTLFILGLLFSMFVMLVTLFLATAASFG